MPHKLYCITSPKIMKLYGGVRGKFGTQCAHAFLHAWWDADERGLDAAYLYRISGFALKITVAIPALETLEAEQEALREMAERYRADYGVTVVTDRGLTVFEGPTLTGIGIGPIDVDAIPAELAGLKLLT